MRMTPFALCRLSVLAFAAFACLAGRAALSEITISLKLDSSAFVSGERVRGVVDVVNHSPDHVSVGRADSRDRLFVEVYRSGGRGQVDETRKGPYVAAFDLRSNEGQLLEVFLNDHYPLRMIGSYLAKPVLVHDGVRFEGQLRAFEIVDGRPYGAAMQMFANRDGLRREFTLVCWNREGCEHLFLKAQDEGPESRGWQTTDLGPLMKITKPTISIRKDGTVIVLHRIDPDNFIRSTFWSVPDGIEFRSVDVLQDPETAGSARVRELYKESGGVKPVERPWWKFW